MLKKRGWFDIPGVQKGERTVVEQLTGLRPALAEARGKRVVDLGSAEGLIAAAMLEAGAIRVECVESNPDYVAEARRYLRGKSAVVHTWDLNSGLGPVGRAEILLLLAILHKLKQPLSLLSQALEVVAPELVVVRYAKDCDGVIVDGRSYFEKQDIAGYLKKCGYPEILREMGPRKELTVYYRRSGGLG